MTVYHGVMTNLYGEERDQAIEAMEDDRKFDRWMHEFEEQGKRKSRPNSNKSSGKMSKEQYLKQYGRIRGGDDG